jgi:hypoxanthine phosphoribosyltransferase
MTEHGDGEGLREHLTEVLFTREQLAAKVEELGTRLTRDYRGKDPLFVGILTGSFPFIADLVRTIDLKLEVDFMAVSSYGKGTKSSGVVKILKDLDRPMQGRHVVLVEDIVDTGLTLKYLMENLATRHPASMSICTLLDKKDARKEPIEIRYAGFDCPDAFVVGYGLDYAGHYRNLPYIGVLSPDRIRR